MTVDRDETIQSDAELQQMLRDEITELNDRLRDRFRELATLTQMLEQADARREADLAHQATVLTRRYEVPGLMARAGQAVADAGFAAGVAPYEELHAAIVDHALFEVDWYLETYPDVAGAKMAPLEHYLRAGAFEGRDPGPDFSSTEYYMANPDVAEGGWPAVAHFVMLGQDEGRALRLNAV